MLREATLALARPGHVVSVLARSERRLADVAAAAAARGGCVRPLALDYRRTAAVVRAIEASVAAHGPHTLVVAWVHAAAPEAPLAIARAVSAGGSGCRFVHVLGSAVARPGRADDGRREAFASVPGVDYREVVLGFVREGGVSRWLTDHEISSGVLRAVAGEAKRTIVGVVEPWSRRP
jgi:hypothetical protein